MCMYMCPNTRDQTCFSVHVSTMFTMATSPERCPIEGGDRIREGCMGKGGLRVIALHT